MPLRMIRFTSSGRRRLSWYDPWVTMAFHHRIAWPARLLADTLRTAFASGFFSGSEMTYVGERCSIVTWAAVRAIDGTKVIAVAPLPMTTTLLSA